MLTSEYLVDDLSEIVRGQVFTDEVSRRLAAQGMTCHAGAIGASTQPGKLHRILTVSVNWGDEAQLRAIANAVAAVLTERSADFFGQFSMPEADIRMIDPPVVSAVGRPAREQLTCPCVCYWRWPPALRWRFCWHYLDNTVRDETDWSRSACRFWARCRVN